MGTGYVILLPLESHTATVVTLQGSQAGSTAASVMYRSSALLADMEALCLLFQAVTQGSAPA